MPHVTYGAPSHPTFSISSSGSTCLQKKYSKTEIVFSNQTEEISFDAVTGPTHPTHTHTHTHNTHTKTHTHTHAHAHAPAHAHAHAHAHTHIRTYAHTHTRTAGGRTHHCRGLVSDEGIV